MGPKARPPGAQQGLLANTCLHQSLLGQRVQSLTNQRLCRTHKSPQSCQKKPSQIDLPEELLEELPKGLPQELPEELPKELPECVALAEAQSK